MGAGSSAAHDKEVGALEEILGRVAVGKARAVREVVQKEFEADVRAHEALISRGNTMLSATGVGVSLLVGLSKELAINTCAERTLLVVALAMASGAMLAVVLGLRIKDGAPTINNKNIAGDPVAESGDPEAWAHDYETQLAVAYFRARIELRDRHALRATVFAFAQLVYLLFLGAVCALGIAIPL